MTNLLNRSNRNSRAVSTIGIPYGTDLEALEKKFPAMMAGILERHSDIMLSEPVYLGVDELANSSVNLKFVVEVDDKNIFAAARQLNRELFLEFRKAGVEVPFPQVDVHQKP
ncbi:MAG: mechanosensitive ion channel family protein, partial [Lachnospiraceae bacterium]|nr:mechanosensitive ion channel family protein [Lachnospiraceae bacterium]